MVQTLIGEWDPSISRCDTHNHIEPIQHPADSLRLIVILRDHFQSLNGSTIGHFLFMKYGRQALKFP